MSDFLHEIFSLGTRLIECLWYGYRYGKWDGLAHLVITAMSFELGGHMGYQNSYLDESFLFHPPKFFLGAGVVWNSPLNFGGDFQNAPISMKPTSFDQKLKSRNRKCQ